MVAVAGIFVALVEVPTDGSLELKVSVKLLWSSEKLFEAQTFDKEASLLKSSIHTIVSSLLCTAVDKMIHC